MFRFRPAIIAVAVVLVAAACRRDDGGRVDDAQKFVAYAVKPGVVRINAFATADFRYPSPAIAEIETMLLADGHESRARGVTGENGVVETGAGGSGTGFIVHPNGLILTSGHVVAPTRDAAALERDLYRNGAIAALLRHFPIETSRTIYRESARPLRRRVVKPGASTTSRNESVELSNGRRCRSASVTGRPRSSTRTIGAAADRRKGLAVPHAGVPNRRASAVDLFGWIRRLPPHRRRHRRWLSRDKRSRSEFNPGTITAITRDVAGTPCCSRTWPLPRQLRRAGVNSTGR